MSRKVNVISYIVMMACMLASLFLVVNLCNQRYTDVKLFNAVLILIGGAVISGFFHTLIHEMGHLIAGMKNGFVFSSITVWFFNWKKVKNKIKFNFVMIGEEAGYTEMIPKDVKDMSLSLKRMSSGGFIASLILTLIGIPPLFISSLPLIFYAFWSMFFPLGVYFFLSTFLPSSSSGVRNDGAIVYGLGKKDASTTVAVNVLKIQQELYNGKTPSEIDEKLYFDLPQLPEDDLYFASILNARYLYYLDKQDYENAKKVTDRLLSIIDYIPKDFALVVKTNALYNACTFDFNEDVADDLVYELEKYLNNVNTSSNVRSKLAYLLYVKREKENLDIFYKKGVKEADRGQIKGLSILEKKLFENMKKDF